MFKPLARGAAIGIGVGVIGDVAVRALPAVLCIPTVIALPLAAGYLAYKYQQYCEQNDVLQINGRRIGFVGTS